jgi:hypothetical protein
MTLMAPAYRVARNHVESGQIRAHVTRQSRTCQRARNATMAGSRDLRTRCRGQPVGSACEVGASVAPDVSRTSWQAFTPPLRPRVNHCTRWNGSP